MQMAQKILRHFYDLFRVKNGFFYSFNVQAQGRCAALSRSVPWSAVLGIGTLSDANYYKKHKEKCDCRKHSRHADLFMGNQKTIVFVP